MSGEQQGPTLATVIFHSASQLVPADAADWVHTQLEVGHGRTRLRARDGSTSEGKRTPNGLSTASGRVKHEGDMSLDAASISTLFGKTESGSINGEEAKSVLRPVRSITTKSH